MTDESKKAKAVYNHRWHEAVMADPERRERYNAKQRERYRLNCEKLRARSAENRRRRKAIDPAAFLAHNNEQTRRHRAQRKVENPSYYWDKQLQRYYGVTLADLQAMLVAQAFKCAICACAIDEVTRRLDHDHATGAVRGLLCHNCNVSLGLLKDSPDIFRAAAEYLERNKEPLQKVGKNGD